MLAEPVGKKLGNENFLTQFTAGGDLGMQLSELRDLFSIHQHARGAAGMVVIRSLSVERECLALKGPQQSFHVAFERTKYIQFVRVFVFAGVENAALRDVVSQR